MSKTREEMIAQLDAKIPRSSVREREGEPSATSKGSMSSPA